MKIFMIGSTSYQERIKEYAEIQRLLGHEVLLPVFDSWKNASVLDILTENRRLMEMADEVHMIYDGRSDGTKFDFGMCFAMRKPLKIVYISDKHLIDGMREYEVNYKKASKDDLNKSMEFHGHPDFYKILDELKELHDKKNYQYASQENPLGNFVRVSKLCSKLLKDDINKPLAIALINMAKQVDAVYDIVGENKANTIETIEDKLKDIAVYAIIAIILCKENKDE